MGCEGEVLFLKPKNIGRLTLAEEKNDSENTLMQVYEAKILLFFI